MSDTTNVSSAVVSKGRRQEREWLPVFSGLMDLPLRSPTAVVLLSDKSRQNHQGVMWERQHCNGPYDLKMMRSRASQVPILGD
jgi:hypothetical protein